MRYVIFAPLPPEGSMNETIPPPPLPVLGFDVPGRVLVRVKAQLHGAPVAWQVRVPQGKETDRASVINSISETISTRGLTQLTIHPAS